MYVAAVVLMLAIAVWLWPDYSSAKRTRWQGVWAYAGHCEHGRDNNCKKRIVTVPHAGRGKLRLFSYARRAVVAGSCAVMLGSCVLPCLCL